MAKPWENDPIVAKPWLDDPVVPERRAAPREPTGPVEAALTGLEAGVDYFTGGLGSAINQVVAAPFTKEGRRGIAEALRRGPRNPYREPTPEELRRDEAARDANEARQYRAMQDQPFMFRLGAAPAAGAMMFPGATAELASRSVQGAGQLLEPVAARAERLAQAGAGKLLRNPTGVGTLAAENVGTPYKAEVLQSILDNPAISLRKGPENIVAGARAAQAEIGPKIEAMADAASKQGATVSVNNIWARFRQSLPDVILKDPAYDKPLQAAKQYLAEAAARRGGANLSPLDTWRLRRQLDKQVFGITGDQAEARNMITELRSRMRSSTSNELGPVMQRTGQTDWAAANKAYSLAEEVESLAIGGVKNVETAAATPHKPFLKLRMIGSNVQPVGYAGTAQGGQLPNVARTRIRQGLAKGIRAMQAPPTVPPSTEGLGPNPYEPGPGVPPGRSLVPAPEPPIRGGVGPSPAQGPIPAGASPYAYPGPAATGLPPARSTQLPASSVLPRRLLPAQATPVEQMSVLPGAGPRFTSIRPPGGAPVHDPFVPGEPRPEVPRVLTGKPEEFRTVRPPGPIAEPPPSLSNAEKAELRARAKALRASKSSIPQTVTPAQARTSEAWSRDLLENPPVPYRGPTTMAEMEAVLRRPLTAWERKLRLELLGKKE